MNGEGTMAAGMQHTVGMPEQEKPTQVYAAATANVVIAARKLIAAAFSGSSAMLSKGISLAQLTGSVVPDAVAAMTIGGILCLVAIFLAIETHALLLGESADPEIVSEIRRIVATDPNVASAHQPLTMHFGPAEILLNMTVDFRPG